MLESPEDDSIRVETCRLNNKKTMQCVVFDALCIHVFGFNTTGLTSLG